jgi:hypothetical protein
MVAVAFTFSRLAVLRFPAGDVGLPLRRVGEEPDDVVPGEHGVHRGVDLGDRDLPVVAGGPVGLLPHAQRQRFEEVPVRHAAGDQRGGVGDAREPAAGTVEAERDRLAVGDDLVES